VTTVTDSFCGFDKFQSPCLLPFPNLVANSHQESKFGIEPELDIIGLPEISSICGRWGWQISEFTFRSH